jgi:hypothetical protein
VDVHIEDGRKFGDIGVLGGAIQGADKNHSGSKLQMTAGARGHDDLLNELKS